tara:strand:- start:8580 stop:9101 length:522 start_codon:yes stop_codon:yes gene_type:complete
MKISYVKILSFSVILFILIVFFISLNRNTIYDTRKLVGQKLNKFEMNSLLDESLVNSEIITTSEYTLINFFASWCYPCRKEHEFLVKLGKESNKLNIVGVNFKDKKSDALKFLKNYKNPYSSVAQDKDGKASISFGIYGIPESILVNKEFIIIKKYLGPLNNEYYKEILELTN